MSEPEYRYVNTKVFRRLEKAQAHLKPLLGKYEGRCLANIPDPMYLVAMAYLNLEDARKRLEKQQQEEKHD